MAALSGPLCVQELCFDQMQGWTLDEHGGKKAPMSTLLSVTTSVALEPHHGSRGPHPVDSGHAQSAGTRTSASHIGMSAQCWQALHREVSLKRPILSEDRDMLELSQSWGRKLRRKAEKAGTDKFTRVSDYAGLLMPALDMVELMGKCRSPVQKVQHTSLW